MTFQSSHFLLLFLHLSSCFPKHKCKWSCILFTRPTFHSRPGTLLHVCICSYLCWPTASAGQEDLPQKRKQSTVRWLVMNEASHNATPNCMKRQWRSVWWWAVNACKICTLQLIALPVSTHELETRQSLHALLMGTEHPSHISSLVPRLP